jgi:SSS family solute:Na+ symporter
MNVPAAVVFFTLFALVTVLGFVAARWRRGDLDQLHEWGLGGRRFGTLVTWFLLGGDLYTAYTFIAVPALVYGAGALGFFAVPFTIIAYPIVFVVAPRLWSVSHARGYITGADFVRGRFQSPLLALAIALTALLATMPYIALQLVGIQVVVAALGIEGQGWMADLPLIVAFVILAAYTYNAGLRAPAMIAVVKDAVIYVTVIAAIFVIPAQLGGFGKIFAAVPPPKLLLLPGQTSTFVTLAFGSSLALMLYPHAMTGLLASSGRRVIQRNTALLPAYSLLLGIIALFGYMALAAHVGDAPEFAHGFQQYGANYAVPALFLRSFPSWFVGVAFAAIAIGALVPAAVMSIASANLFTRNIYREYLRPRCTARREARRARLHRRLAAEVRHPAPAPRRRLDPADVPRDDPRPLHAVAPPLGVAGRVGGRDDARHVDVQHHGLQVDDLCAEARRAERARIRSALGAPREPGGDCVGYLGPQRAPGVTR